MTLELKRGLPAKDLQVIGDALAQLERGEQTVTLPGSLAPFLSELLRHVQRGEDLTVFTSAQELTTNEAAELLGVSRPFLVSHLLKTGTLPFHYVGSHRRIYVSDLLAYQQEQRRQEELLAKIAREAQDMDLY